MPTEQYRRFNPRVAMVDGEWVATLYEGDASFDSDPLDLDVPGPRHRLHLTQLPWRYELDGV